MTNPQLFIKNPEAKIKFISNFNNEVLTRVDQSRTFNNLLIKYRGNEQ